MPVTNCEKRKDNSFKTIFNANEIYLPWKIFEEIKMEVLFDKTKTFLWSFQLHLVSLLILDYVGVIAYSYYKQHFVIPYDWQTVL